MLLCARSAKRPKPPNGNSLVSVQRSASRSEGDFDAKRAGDLKCRLVSGGAVERDLYRRAGEPQLDARPLASERCEKIAEREARVDGLVMPHEAAIGAETARNRRPRELKFHTIEPLGDILTGMMTVHHDNAVVDADLRKRCGSVGIGLERAGKRLDQARPVRLPAGQEGHRDGRPHQRHVGDFNPAGEERKIAQTSGQFVDDHGGLAGTIVAEQHVVKAHRAGRKQRDRDLTAEHRVKPGHGVNFPDDRIAHRCRRNEDGQRDKRDKHRPDHGGNGNREAL